MGGMVLKARAACHMPHRPPLSAVTPQQGLASAIATTLQRQ